MFFFFNSRIILIIFILQDIQGIARFIFSCLARFVAHTYMLRRFLFLLTPTGPGLTKGEGGGGIFVFHLLPLKDFREKISSKCKRPAFPRKKTSPDYLRPTKLLAHATDSSLEKCHFRNTGSNCLLFSKKTRLFWFGTDKEGRWNWGKKLAVLVLKLFSFGGHLQAKFCACVGVAPLTMEKLNGRARGPQTIINWWKKNKTKQYKNKFKKWCISYMQTQKKGK